MTVYSSTGNLLRLEGFQSYAQAYLHDKISSAQYKRRPLAAMIMARGQSESSLGRPGAYDILGGKPQKRKAMRTNYGGDGVKFGIHSDTSDGGDTIGARGTTNRVDHSQDQNHTSAHFRHVLYHQPIMVWNNTLRKARGAKDVKSFVKNALNDAVDQAMEKATDNINILLYLGSPTSQTADVWDMPLGLTELCQESNTYGNVDRSTHTSFASNVVSTAKTPALDLVDDANITQGLVNNGPGIDCFLMSNANYLKVKHEALARQCVIIQGGTKEAAEIGITKEAVSYQGVWFICDPTLDEANTNSYAVKKNINADLSNYVFGLSLEDLYLDFIPGENWRVSKFVDQGEQNPGGDDAVTAGLYVGFSMFHMRPDQCIVYTNVS